MVCYGIWQIYFEFSFQKWDVRCYPITAAAYYHVQGKEITMHNFLATLVALHLTPVSE